MKLRFTQNVSINGITRGKDSEEEVEGRLAETLVNRGWAVDADAPVKKIETESIPSVENLVELPRKKTYEDAVKRTAEKAVTMEKPKKPAKKKGK
jgi:hypothetical protein